MSVTIQCLCISDGSSLSLKSREETITLAAKEPDERRAWIQLLRQVLYRDAGGGKIYCHDYLSAYIFAVVRKMFVSVIQNF